MENWTGESRLCLYCNRWVARQAIAQFFGTISRLGDGTFWYALMLAIALLVAASRVVLGLHYPSDVVAATFIGLTLVGTSLWIPRLFA